MILFKLWRKDWNMLFKFLFIKLNWSKIDLLFNKNDYYKFQSADTNPKRFYTDLRI